MIKRERLEQGVTNLRPTTWYLAFCVRTYLVWIRNQLDVTYVLSFISPLQVVQHVSGNHVPIFRS